MTEKKKNRKFNKKNREHGSRKSQKQKPLEIRLKELQDHFNNKRA